VPSYNANINVTVSGQNRLNYVLASVEKLNSIVSKLKPINILAPGAGSGGDAIRKAKKQLDDFARAVVNFQPQGIQKRAKELSNTLAGSAAQADALGIALANVGLKSGGFKKQVASVKNYALALEAARRNAERLDAINRSVQRGARVEAIAQRFGTTSEAVEQRINNMLNIRYEKQRQAASEEYMEQKRAEDFELRLNKIIEKRRQTQQTQRSRSEAARGAVGNAIIGGAFPLLFGQGPEAALGGGLGGLAGGLIGGPYGFALSLAGTVIGDVLGQAEFNTPLGKFTGSQKQDEQRVTAQTAGAQAQATANILKDKQDQLNIEKQIYGIQTKILGLSSIQVQREVALTEAKAARRDALKAIARDENIAPSIAGALMQQVQTEYERKRLLVDQTYIREQELDTVNKLYTAERNRLNQASTMLDMVRKTSASGLSAAQAIGGARVRRLERVAAGIQEQDPAQAAGLQAKAASEIAAASERAYKIRLLDIQVAQLQLQIENKIQQSKLAQVKAELSVAKARGATVEALQAYNDSIKAQQEAVTISSAAVQAGEAQAQFARAEAAAQYSSELQGAVERLDKAGNLAASVGDTAATGIRDLAVVTDRASGAALNLAESWFRVGSAIASAVQQQATAATQQVQLVQTPAPAAPRERSYAEVNGVRTYFAEGGFVTRPTNALIGEGGESEYVIPSSKMSTAMQRYSAGVRGEAVTAGAVTAGSTSTANYSNQQNAYYGGGGGTSVNITTGPVIRMDNRDYVTMTDMQRGMAAAAGASQASMMRSMSRSYATRRSMGL
jgi:hypothetical protein